MNKHDLAEQLRDREIQSLNELSNDDVLLRSVEFMDCRRPDITEEEFDEAIRVAESPKDFEDVVRSMYDRHRQRGSFPDVAEEREIQELLRLSVRYVDGVAHIVHGIQRRHPNVVAETQIPKTALEMLSRELDDRGLREV